VQIAQPSPSVSPETHELAKVDIAKDKVGRTAKEAKKQPTAKKKAKTDEASAADDGVMRGRIGLRNQGQEAGR
jgi:hypothetical protein